MRPVGILRQ
jgi:hypothetical protein